MITWFEGLPRAGKTYSAVRDEIIGALRNGRSVVAYVEGLDAWKIADHVGGDRLAVYGLLTCLRREEVPDIWRLAGKDALVVIDEAQNFWPTAGGKNRLSKEMEQWIAEHGHLGLDIVLLGQSMKDIHTLFRRRIERKYYFLKKSAIGRPDSFSCTISTVIPKGNDVELVPVQTINGTYDPVIFPLYASHEPGTQNKSTLVDKRAVIWSHPLFRRWLPIAGVVFIGLGVYVWSLFHGGLEKGLVAKGQAPAVATGGQVAVRSPASEHTQPAAETARIPVRADLVEPDDIIDELSGRGRIRLLGYVALQGQTRGWVEWRDSANNLLQQMTFLDLGGLGWSVLVNTQGTYAVLTKGVKQITALAWPIDRSTGRASETQLVSVSGESASPASQQGAQAPCCELGACFSEKPPSRFLTKRKLAGDPTGSRKKSQASS